MSRPGRIQLPRLPRRRRWRNTVLAVAESLPYQGAVLVMGAVIAVAVPAAPEGSRTPGLQGVAAFATVMAVRPAAQVAVRAVQRRLLARGWRRG